MDGRQGRLRHEEAHENILGRQDRNDRRAGGERFAGPGQHVGAQTNTAYTGNNATIAPSSIVLPTGIANESALGSTNVFNLTLIDYAVELAYTISPLIRPIKIMGAEKYVGFLHPFQVTDMRVSVTTGQWLDIEKAAATGGEVLGQPDLHRSTR